MTVLTTTKPITDCASDPMLPNWAKIVKIENEAPGVNTYWLQFTDPKVQKAFSFLPGQFNLLTIPGYGEAAISISSHPKNKEAIGHTIRLTGNVTNAIDRLGVGGTLGLRGPFGSCWPVEELKGRDIYIAAGGIGLPPLRPAIYHIIDNRADYGKVVLIYGARTPEDLQFTKEFDDWEKADIELMICVDSCDDTWTGLVGVVPMLFYNLRIDPKKGALMTCGPEIMIHFSAYEAIARRIPRKRIFVSLEKNMKCGFGSCGHCQLGPYFVCKDGPVFSYKQIGPYLEVEDF
ncbi:MAG: Ni/Fe hydrogenase subunit gamma [Anaerolineales bacterium]|nr:Ni/Fe hydrogenase subunit gamma [Anaerolineales bacterium]